MRTFIGWEKINDINFGGKTYLIYWDSIEKYFKGLKHEEKETSEVKHKIGN